MAWPHGIKAEIGWLTEVGFADKNGRSLVTTASGDFIERPSNGLLTWLNLAADVEFEWSRTSYQNNCMLATALMILPHLHHTS